MTAQLHWLCMRADALVATRPAGTVGAGAVPGNGDFYPDPFFGCHMETNGLLAGKWTAGQPVDNCHRHPDNTKA